MTTYPRISGLIPDELEDRLAELLDDLPVLGCQLSPAGDGLQALEVFLAPVRGDGASVTTAHRLTAAGARSVQCSMLADQDWLEVYRRQVTPFPVGQRWWIDPHPDRPTRAPSGRLRLAVEPRMAFGSGSHESTQLVLLELERMDLCGRSVLDIGTGSGILALAADRLGARPVIGFDLDPDAIWVARQTAIQQEWPAGPRLFVGTLRAVAPGPFDVVLCNMLPSQFLPFVAEIALRLARDGAALFSGVLESERGAVSDRLAEAGLEVCGRTQLDDWTSLVARLAGG